MTFFINLMIFLLLALTHPLAFDGIYVRQCSGKVSTSFRRLKARPSNHMEAEPGLSFTHKESNF